MDCGSGLAARLIGVSERVESVAFSPDGQWLAAVGGNPGRSGEIQVWKLADHSLVLSRAATFDTLYGVSWSPDGKFLAFGCGDHGDNSVRALEVATGREVLSNGAHGDWALDTAREYGADEVQLSVWSENFGGYRFYERYGFAKVADVTFRVGEQVDHEFLFSRML